MSLAVLWLQVEHTTTTAILPSKEDTVTPTTSASSAQGPSSSIHPLCPFCMFLYVPVRKFNAIVMPIHSNQTRPRRIPSVQTIISCEAEWKLLANSLSELFTGCVVSIPFGVPIREGELGGGGKKDIDPQPFG